ncbi:MAG: hypothetical protein GF317_24955 [Candidatus Lokiarchaeota archaeon]|nr:hypothetical protein [Candidatus Lokiarchaeota archaeon]MBD3202609.1 hypothetical protein [Candidatus Lokiarchaeota archaeon]
MIKITDLNWGIIEIIYLISLFGIGFMFTYLIMPYIIKFMKKKGYVGKDIHKNAKPEVAESGGIGILFGILITSIFILIFFPIYLNQTLIFILTILLTGLIGFLDDRIRLRSRYKIALNLLTGLLIFMANNLKFIDIPNPIFPIIGQLRLSVLYPILIPLLVAVFTNTVNMLEGYNGEGSGTISIVLIFLIICSAIWNSSQGLVFSIACIGTILAFYKFNKYPAKIFPGDVGTLIMGSMIACIALFGAMEVIAVCALLNHVFNSFYYIFSVRGFFESQEIHQLRDDIILLNDDQIGVSPQKDALLTMPRLILVHGSLSEKKLVDKFIWISITSGFIAIITTFLMLWTISDTFTNIILVLIPFLLIPIILIYYKVIEIRFIILEIIILYILTIILLFFIDIIIIPISLEINLVIIKIPVNILFSILVFIPLLIVWYYITIKYLNSKLDQLDNKE